MDEPLFFLSYARNDKNGYLEKFYEELCEAVARWSARPAASVGFFDREGIEMGAEWRSTLVEGLQASRVMVALYSPSYFTREYCGKEWMLFRMRQDEYVRAGKGAARPPVILPVLWMPQESLPEPLPAAVGELQFDHGSLGAKYTQEGLLQLRTLSSSRDDYHVALNELAKRIVSVSREHDLPRAPGVATPDDVPSAFAPPPAPAGAPAPGPAAAAAPAAGLGKEGPRYVQCVYVAARRQELADGGVRTVLEGYGEEKGMEWSPYHPKLRDEIGRLVNDVTLGEGFLYTYDDVDDKLVARLDEAKRRNKIVLLVVDAWTLKLDPYQACMREVDQRSFYNTAVLVPWNPEDPETMAKRPELQLLLESTFLERSISRDQFADSIESVEALKNELKVALTRARMRVINAATVLKRVGDRTVAKPVVAGPGSSTP